MIASSDTTSCRSALAALCTLVAMSGCGSRPGIQVVEEPARAVSIAEGKRLLEMGRAVEAVSAFRQLLRRKGADLQALNGLAIAYSELGRTDLATEIFSRALTMAPGDAATLNNIGFSALRRADVLLARHYLTKAQGQNGDLEEVEGNLARVALLEGIELKPVPAHAENGMMHAAEPRRLPTEPHKTSRDPAAEMIDFTTVMDPFAGAAASQ